MTHKKTQHDVPSAALWASAFIIVALIIVEAGRTTGSLAMAEMVSQAGEYTVMTTEGGTDEPLFVIDERREKLLVYQVEQQRRVQLRTIEDLPQLFRDARSRAEGRH